jgi:hypothetical protein
MFSKLRRSFRFSLTSLKFFQQYLQPASKRVLPKVNTAKPVIQLLFSRQ